MKLAPQTIAIGATARRAAAILAAAFVAGAAFAVSPAAAGDMDTKVVSPVVNPPGDANVPDAGNVVNGGGAVVAPRGAGHGAPAYVRPQADRGRIVTTPPNGGDANVPDPGNVVNGPSLIVR